MAAEADRLTQSGAEGSCVAEIRGVGEVLRLIAVARNACGEYMGLRHRAQKMQWVDRRMVVGQI